MRSRIQSDARDGIAAWWVRTSLQQYRLLERDRSVDPNSRSVIVFAIQWAPFGGVGADELFVNFGVTRKRFLQMVGEALGPRATDNQSVRGLKRCLLEALTRAWRDGPDAGSASGVLG
ncbi:hypothetical protein ACFXG4_44735 [Nocardia sp. NPDC059246]|uniref:hypothetical protein n=1 Tax=unclassified Nocardia TaxID=2637762 RepID=UPI0036C1C86E